jgi:hypothetical protein
MTGLANHPTAADLERLPMAAIASLPADQLVLLQDEVDALLDQAKRLSSRLEAALSLRYAERTKGLRQALEKDTGTIRFHDGEVVVVADIPRKVSWDQTQLAALVERISAQGEDPADYVEVVYRVPERRYTAWPATIREAFAPARTVQPGKPAFRLGLTTIREGDR